MSPNAALHSHIFRGCLLLALVVLAMAGAILLILSKGLKKDVRSVWLTYRSWLVMVPAVFLCVFLGRWAVIIGTTILAVAGFKEFARATGLYQDWRMTGAVYVGIVAVGIASLMHDPFKHIPGWFGFFLAMPVFVISLILIIPVIRNIVRGQLQATALAILGFIYIGWMFGHLGFLANFDNPYGYVIYVILATEFNDVAAFTFGKLFGRHPLRSNISPRKTWEGSLGALAVAMCVPWAARFALPGFSTGELLLTGLLVGVGGQLGDLCISVIKRDIGIKDMGAAIPGHGGILDRIDSLVFVAPLFLHMVQFFNGLR